RIGRTGRAFNKGDAITFANPAEMYYIEKIEKLIRQQIPVAPVPDEVLVEETSFHERQEMAREIDNQKRKENPDFKGAFHEKKHVLKEKERKKSGGFAYNRKSNAKKSSAKADRKSVV